MVRWFLLKNRRHQGPYTREQLEREQAEGRLQPWDFLISIDSLDAGQLQYQPLYVVLDLPAPVVQAHHVSSTPTIETALPKLGSSSEGATHVPHSLDTHDKGRDVFEKTDSVDFVARHHSPDEVTAVSGLSANRRVIETATQGNFTPSKFWSGRGMRVVYFVGAAVVAWNGWQFLAPGLPSKSTVTKDTPVTATNSEASDTAYEAPSPSRSRGEAVLRVPEGSDSRSSDRPPPIVARYPREERPMPEENSLNVPVDSRSVPAIGGEENLPRGAPVYTGDMPPEAVEFPSNPRARMGRQQDGGDDIEPAPEADGQDRPLSEEGDESDGSDSGDY